ncbi:MAG: peroxiredoxin family protein, partial [Candidatus Cryptobacteroides sp.]
MEYYSARLHAELNRNSLIGRKAPALDLRTLDGRDCRIPDEGERRLKVLYFYDTDCPVCSAQTSLLKAVLKDFDVVPYAIYTGTEREKWLKYAEERLDFAGDTVNLWDPDRTSDFEMLYGVIQTPAIFLVDGRGIIIGRRLDPSSLGKLLTEISLKEDMEYGSDEVMEIFGKIFAPIEGGMGCEGLSRMASHICDIALENRDTTLFKQMTGDLLYFIADKNSENYKCGTPDFADRFILEREDIWNSPDDTLKVISLARFLKDAALLSPIGTRLPKVKVQSVEITRGKDGKPALRNVRADLSKQKSTLVVFRIEDCGTCREKTESLTGKLVSEGGLHIGKAGNIRKILLIDMNRLWEEEPGTATLLSDNIDLTGIPMVIATNRNGLISRKYL